jgi:multiple sugar transport system permease protein
MATQVSSIGTLSPEQKFPWGRTITWVVIGLFVVVTLFPFVWMARTSLTTRQTVYSNANQLIPAETTLDNYRRVLDLTTLEEAVAAGGSGQSVNFPLAFRNSVIVSSLITGGQIFFSGLGAYAFARLRFPFREQLFFLYLTGLMVPGIILLIPNFVLMRQLGWIGTFQGVIAPAFLMTPFSVFFLRQFFLTLSRELEEAAILDGCSRFGIFWRVALPLSRPPLITLAILTFIYSWNDYLWPLLVGRDEEVRVLSVALSIFRSQTPQGGPDWGGLMAGATLAIIPTIILFLVLGRKVVDSIQFSGFK